MSPWPCRDGLILETGLTGTGGQAIGLPNPALAIARDIGNRQGEANALDYLGRARLASDDARQAVTCLSRR